MRLRWRGSGLDETKRLATPVTLLETRLSRFVTMALKRAGGLAVFASLFLASCSGGGGNSSPTPTVTEPPPVVKSYTFPQGDATASSGATAWDIVGVTTTLSGQFANAGGDSYDTLRVDVTFTQNVSNALPLPGQPLTSGNQLGISIGLDTDGNPNTGFYEGCAASSSQTPFEYATDQGNDPSRLQDGNYSILMNGGPISSGGQNPPSEAMVSVSGNTLSETFFLTAIGVHAGAKVPKIGIAVAAANGTKMNASGVGPTDCVPISPAVEFYTS